MPDEEIDLTLEDTRALISPPAPCAHTYLAHIIKWEHPALVMAGCSHSYCGVKISRQVLSHSPKEAVWRAITGIHHHYDTVLCVCVCDRETNQQIYKNTRERKWTNVWWVCFYANINDKKNSKMFTLKDFLKLLILEWTTHPHIQSEWPPGKEKK